MAINQENPDLRGFLDILEEYVPDAVFESFRPKTGSPASQRFFQNSFNDIFNEYTGGLISQFSQAQSDNPLIFTDTGQFRLRPTSSPKNLQAFLENNPQELFSNFLQEFPFTARFSNLTPTQRGFNPAKYAPTTRAFF